MYTVRLAVEFMKPDKLDSLHAQAKEILNNLYEVPCSRSPLWFDVFFVFDVSIKQLHLLILFLVIYWEGSTIPLITFL